MNHLHKWCSVVQRNTTNSSLRLTGWRRPIGCLKLQVIFRKRATNHRALFREMTYRDKTSCDSTPPCDINPYAGCRIKFASHALKQSLDSRNFLLISETKSRSSEPNRDFVPRIEDSENRGFVPRIENSEKKFRESRLCCRDQRIQDFVWETKSRFSLNFRNWFSSGSDLVPELNLRLCSENRDFVPETKSQIL